MNLLNKTRQLCRQYQLRPSRWRGQNFLINQDYYDLIIKAAFLTKADTVLEVGPGLGFLTMKLAERVKRVMAVELDDKLSEALKASLAEQGINNVEAVNEDILKFSIFNYQTITNYKVVANLPYNITSIFLRKFLSAKIKPKLMVLMLQREVAERIAARPPKMSILAVSAQYYSRPEIIETVAKENFWPQPRVDSAIIRLKPYSSQELSFKNQTEEEKEFFRLVRIGFSARRKMLKNNLAAGYYLAAEQMENMIKLAGFSQKVRAQELSLNDWLKLFGVFRKKVL